VTCRPWSRLSGPGLRRRATRPWRRYNQPAAAPVLFNKRRGIPETEAYAYDLAGNRSPAPPAPAWVYNPKNRLKSQGGINYDYDRNGNLNLRQSATETWTYSWDVENRLTEAYLAGALVARYMYDALGRRIAKDVPQGTSTIAWDYRYDGQNVIKVDHAGCLGPACGYPGLSYYWIVHGLDVDEPLQTSPVSPHYGYGMPTFWHGDALGSIVKSSYITGAAGGAFAYDAFGRSIDGTSLASAMPPFYGFTGREWDAETGFYYYRARYYDPKIGRFISEDPIRFAGGMDFYAYVGNAPTGFNDPFGLFPGQMPPSPPAYGPGWSVGQWDNGKWFVKDPEGNFWTAHPEDDIHWRHWDKQDPNGKDQGDWPPTNKKPRSNQKKLPPDRCEADPSGDAPEWKPPVIFSPMGVPSIPIVPMPGYVPPLPPLPPIWVWPPWFVFV
jgi:RHS repeat-associated protein